MALFVFAATLIPQISVGRIIPLVQTIQTQSLICLNSLMAFSYSRTVLILTAIF